MEGKYRCAVGIFLFAAATLIHAGKSWPPPPAYPEKAKMARYLMHNADWGVVSAYSPKYEQPFGTLQSFADGTVSNSTGIPYFYIAKMSTTWHNIDYNNTVSMTLTQAMSDWCMKKNLDPESPLCARLMVTGNIIPVTTRIELALAKHVLFSRHPTMKRWPARHDWTFCKLQLTGIYVLDFFGGLSHVPVGDYFKAT